MGVVLDDCIEWDGSRTQRGYGRIGSSYAHRMMWERTHGRALQPGEVVRHSCDNPPCVNPAHLLVGTQADNIRDSIARGRYRRYRRYSDDVVQEWIARYEAGETSAVLAAEWDCHPNTVTAVIRRHRPELTAARHGVGRWKGHVRAR